MTVGVWKMDLVLLLSPPVLGYHSQVVTYQECLHYEECSPIILLYLWNV